MPSRDDVDAYLQRLGLEREPPSVEALFRLHRAQVEQIPYETTWIHSGERWDVDREAALRRIAHDGRGGYCFHLNGALSLLLAELGYQVTLHAGGVHGPEGVAAEHMGNHLVLTVSGLPSPANPGGDWYVDAGLGDALHEPLPLLAGRYEQGPFTYTLGSAGDAAVPVDWLFTHDPSGSFAAMAFATAPALMTDFAEHNVRLSTSPESGFVKVCTVQRRHASGTDILRGLILQRSDGQHSDGQSSHAQRVATTLESRDDWFDALAELNLSVRSMPPDQRTRLWERVRATHRAWQEHAAG